MDDVRLRNVPGEISLVQCALSRWHVRLRIFSSNAEHAVCRGGGDVDPDVESVKRMKGRAINAGVEILLVEALREVVEAAELQ